MKKAQLGEEIDEDDDDLKGLSEQERKKRFLEERKRHKEELEEERTEEWKRHKEELEEERKRHKEEVEKEREEMEKEREEMEKERKVLEEERKVLDENLSVKVMLGSMPRMVENREAKPAIIRNEIAHKRVNEYREKFSKYQEDLANLAKKSSTNRNPPQRIKFHEPAEIKVIELSSELFDGFEVHVKNGANRLIKSRLALEASGSCLSLDADGRCRMAHYNETSPKDYLSMVIKDVIECCGFREQVKVVKEATLFSLRPDLIVVVREGRLLFVAEVINPSGQTGPNVFKSETAGGQMLNYLKALKQQGIDWPFALLSTYNETIIARIPDEEQQYKEIFKKGSENAKEWPSKRHKKDNAESHGKPPSPSKPAFCMTLSSIPEQTGSESPPLLEDHDEEKLATERCESSQSNSGSSYDYKGRKVIYSQVFNVDCLYKALVLVLESSMESFNQLKQRSDPFLPTEGSSLPDKELCTLYDQSFSYEKVSIKSVTYSMAPQVSKMKKYHLLCQVGQGRPVKTILCSSSSGRLFAVKLFLISASTLYSEEERKTQEQRVFERYAEAKKECELWRRLEKRYKFFCHVVTLNGIPAMTMPYFPPVPYEQRKAALNPIRKRLEYIAGEGYYYAKEDLGWRHFGCRWNNGKMEITLLDLGSLSEEKSDLDEQVNELEQKMTLKENEEAKPVLA